MISTQIGAGASWRKQWAQVPQVGRSMRQGASCETSGRPGPAAAQQGEQLKTVAYRLHRLGWTQQETADKIGVAQNHFNKQFLHSFPDLEKGVKNLLSEGIPHLDQATDAPCIRRGEKCIRHGTAQSGPTGEGLGSFLQDLLESDFNNDVNIFRNFDQAAVTRRSEQTKKDVRPLPALTDRPTGRKDEVLQREMRREKRPFKPPLYGKKAPGLRNGPSRPRPGGSLALLCLGETWSKSLTPIPNTAIMSLSDNLSLQTDQKEVLMDKQMTLWENTAGLTASQQERLVSEFGESFKRYSEAAKAKGTRRVYASHWRGFETFCAERGLDALPAHPAAVKAHLTHLADSGKSLSTVKVARAAIANAHNELDLPNPTTTKSVSNLVSGIANEISKDSARYVTKKDELTLDELRPMIATLDDTPRGKLDKALLLCGFAGAFRRSELVGLNMADIKVNGDVKVMLRRSKTDQQGKGKPKGIPHIEGANTDLCAHCALLEWLAVRGHAPGAVFLRIVRGEVSKHRPSARYLARLASDTAAHAGLVGDYAAHSLRSGFITAALGNKAPLETVVGQTGQTYDTALDYDRRRGERGADAARYAYNDKGQG